MGTHMFGPATVWRRVAAPVIFATLLAGCGASNFNRSDAISSLQAAGATSAEATCIADTLIQRESLDSADPRSAESAQDRLNLLSANEHCVSTEVLPTVDSGVEPSVDEAASPDVVELATSTGGLEQVEAEATAAVAELLTSTPAELRSGAIARLISLGNSEAVATCVVDNLIAQDAVEVISSDDLGLSLDIREASAIAACA